MDSPEEKDKPSTNATGKTQLRKSSSRLSLANRIKHTD
jgi:hypothetical protein